MEFFEGYFIMMIDGLLSVDKKLLEERLGRGDDRKGRVILTTTC